MRTRRPPTVRHIVVELSPSEAGRAALAWAIAEAERRRARLDLVRVAETRTQHEALVLDDALEQVGTADVPVRAILARGRKRTELLRISEGADLLVLGEPMSPESLSDASCPVVVFNADATIGMLAGFVPAEVAA